MKERKKKKVRKIPFAGVELTSQRVKGLQGSSELPYVFFYLLYNPSIITLVKIGIFNLPSRFIFRLIF